MSPKSPIEVRLIENDADFELARQIRHEVFVIEQNVPTEEEFDEYERLSRQFLAIQNGQPVGTCRWRKASDGIKLERFAVAKSARSSGVGSILVSTALSDVDAEIAEPEIFIYLHAQVTAMGLYQKFGFQKVGEMFEECNIQHYKMTKNQINENIAFQ